MQSSTKSSSRDWEFELIANSYLMLQYIFGRELTQNDFHTVVHFPSHLRSCCRANWLRMAGEGRNSASHFISTPTVDCTCSFLVKFFSYCGLSLLNFQFYSVAYSHSTCMYDTIDKRWGFLNNESEQQVCVCPPKYSSYSFLKDRFAIFFIMMTSSMLYRLVLTWIWWWYDRSHQWSLSLFR